jgi:hypothetical protein
MNTPTNCCGLSSFCVVLVTRIILKYFEMLSSIADGRHYLAAEFENVLFLIQILSIIHGKMKYLFHNVKLPLYYLFIFLVIYIYFKNFNDCVTLSDFYIKLKDKEKVIGIFLQLFVENSQKYCRLFKTILCFSILFRQSKVIS